MNFAVNRNFPNKALSHLPKTHYSIIPLFQHSNWGEAPKFNNVQSTFMQLYPDQEKSTEGYKEVFEEFFIVQIAIRARAGSTARH